MNERLVALLNEQKLAMVDSLLAGPAAQRIQALSEDERRAIVLAGLDGLIGLLQQEQPMLGSTLAEMAQTQMRAGAERDDVLDLLDAQRIEIYRVVQSTDEAAGESIGMLRVAEDLMHHSARTIVDTYHHDVIERLKESSAAQERLRAAIQELSTPIIPVYNGVLVVPLIGRVDSARAQSLTEALLEAIAREQAEMVLLDITGVAVVDTSVANHLMQTARAAGLLGSQVVLVGISAEVAQTLVQLGLDLGQLVTLSNLQNGLEYALAQQGLAITDRV